MYIISTMPRYPIVPTPLDDVRTTTSASQVSTEIDISGQLLSWLDIDDQKKKQSYQPIDSVLLCRPKHIAYIYPHLARLPGSFVALDASRGWIMYWIIGSLATLGVQVKEEERLKVINTLLSFQHPQGGFGGGPGQLGHVASTYAAICTIATLLDGADQSLVDQTWAQVDAKKMYQWILSLKQPDGSFAMHRDGETDVRGCYAALVVATALNLLTPELVQNVPKYIVSCQTYEGGMSATSISTPHAQNEGVDMPDCPKAAPVGEAHGGYTSCALAAYFLVQGLPSLKDSPMLNYQSCLRWAAQMQGLPIEGGGFRGRTNKLVDGCYSWWCAGTFPLLQALISPTVDFPDQLESMDLFDRQALQEYILLISQDLTPKNNKGGLRDKPAASPDLYHTHYILSGLSTAQHSQRHSHKRIREIKERFKTPNCSECILGASETETEAIERMKEIYSRALAWESEKEKELIVGLISNQTVPYHPVFNIKATAMTNVMNYFYHQN